MVENVLRRLADNQRQARPGAVPEVLRAACLEVARPAAFGVGIILMVFLPIDRKQFQTHLSDKQGPCPHGFKGQVP